MAHFITAPRIEKEKRVSSVLGMSCSFARELEVQLSEQTGPKISASLVEKLENHIRIFPTNAGSAAAAKYGDLDRSGTALWNLCAKLKRNNDQDQQHSLVTTMTRLYSFLMLDCAQNSGKGSFTNGVRVIKVALKTARSCLEGKQLDFALKSLEKAAGYEDQLKDPQVQLSPEDVEAHERLSSEYFVLRIMLEWRQDRLQVAEHMYMKALPTERNLDPNAAESLADVLFEMGKELLGKKQYELAVKWLDRAFAILNGQELDKLSIDASELRTSIIQCSVKALVGTEQKDAIEQAHSLVGLLESELGDKLVVLLLRLELLSVFSEAFDSATYSTVLQRIIRTVILTDASFKLIMHHIRKLNDKSSSVACKALDEFLTTRIFQAEKDEWFETVLINRLWMATGQQDGLNVISSVQAILDTVITNINKPISSSATFAAQMLLWKQIESNAAQRQYDAAAAWCRLAMHAVFENADDLNRAKIARKLLLCSLAQQDISGAREIYSSLPKAAKDDPRTRFLMYKIAIRSGEVDLASECLEAVHIASSNNPNLLYACVLDAQQVGDKGLAIAALQLVLDKHQYDAPSAVHLPALLRCTIRLIVSQMEAKSSSEVVSVDGHIVDQLCKLFEAGVDWPAILFSPVTLTKEQATAQAQKLPAQEKSAEKLFDINELDWFSKNAYNLALKYAASWEPRKVLRMLQSCIRLIRLYPEDIEKQIADDLSLRSTFCHFLATVLLISLARAEDDIEIQLQDYLTIRKHVESFDSSLQKKLETLEGGPARDLVKKLSILLAYDFEAAVRLKKWEDLMGIILKADVCKCMKVFELMADCILCCEAPASVVIPTLKRIVNEAWTLESFDVERLTRYMRCLFQYSLPQGDSVSEDLLDQIYDLGKEALESEQPYPAEELEWISTTAWNRAVDFYGAGEDVACKSWASKAINIASLCPDHGALQRLLEEKLLGLSWNT